MLEIIALIFLTKNMGALAQKKGLKPGPWKLYTVLAWFGAELVGALLAVMLLGGESMILAIFIGMGCAVASYFILRANLNKRPDAMEDDINNIGVNDLYPDNHRHL